MHLFDAHPERILERIILALIRKEKLVEFDDTVTVKERERSQIGKVARLVQQRPVNTIAAKNPPVCSCKPALIALQMVALWCPVSTLNQSQST